MSSSKCWPETAHATATGWRRGARHIKTAPGFARLRRLMRKSAGSVRTPEPPELKGDHHGYAEYAALGGLRSQPQRARAQACRVAARGRRHNGAAGGARHLHPPRRGIVDLGGAVADRKSTR